MKRILLLFCLSISYFPMCAQYGDTLNRTMQWQDSIRKYVEYIPQCYSGDTAVPLVVCLHGLGDNAYNMLAVAGFWHISDQFGWITVSPQALNTMMGTCWNAGVGVAYGNLSYALGEGYDDVGFINAMIDTICSQYNIDTSRIYVLGFSMGGFMTHRLAIECGRRFRAACAISGTIGNLLPFTSSTSNINMMHIHGTNDNMVGYTNGNCLTLGNFNIGMGAEQVINLWRNYNQCTTADTLPFDDTMYDGLTFENRIYTNEHNGAKVSFIKVNNGEHTWYGWGENDIDYTSEIYRFFVSVPLLIGDNGSDSTTNIPLYSNNKFQIYPNPAQDVCYITFDNQNTNNQIEMQLFDIFGRTILSKTFLSQVESFNVNNIPNGTYMLRFTKNGNFVETKKLIIAH